jgi:WD40 repeat protein/uncharacterized caspase-like protein
MSVSGRTAPLPAQADPRQVIQTGHSADVSAVALSQDGRLALTGSEDGTAILWDVESGRQIWRLPGHTPPVNGLALSPDAAMVLTVDAGHVVRVWDTATGEERFRAWGRAAAFSPIGKMMVAADGGTLQLWDTSSGLKRESTVALGMVFTSVAFAPAGGLVWAGGSDGHVSCFDVQSGRELQDFAAHANSVEALILSADGRILLTLGVDALVKNPLDSVRKVRSVRLWNTVTGRQIRKFRSNREELIAASLSGDGQEVAIADPGLHVLDARTGAERRRLRSDSTALLSFSRSNRLLIAGWRTAQVLDTRLDTTIKVLSGLYETSLKRLTLSRDGRFLLAEEPFGTGTLWDLEAGSPFEPFSDYQPAMRGLLADGTKLLVRDALGSWLWDLSGHEAVQPIDGEDKENDRFLSFPGGRSFLSWGSGQLVLWNAETGEPIRSLDGSWKQAGQETVAISPDGRYIAADAKRGVCLWNTATGEEVWCVTSSLVKAITFSPDSHTLYTGGPRGIRVSDVATGARIGNLASPTDDITSLAMTQEGELLIAGTEDGTVLEIAADSGQLMHSLKAHSGKVVSSIVSADGRLLITAGRSDGVHFWDLRSGELLVSLFRHTIGDYWLAISPQGFFDSNSLDGWQGVNFVFPEEPLRPLPPETFIRELYEPRLLARILAGERLVPNSSFLPSNRALPRVEILDVQLSKKAPDRIEVTVRVQGERRVTRRDGREFVMETGAYDLRLFRNGQLVGGAPQAGGPIPLQNGEAVLTFPDIRLRRKRGFGDIELAAYAFNSAGFKGPTARWEYPLPPEIPAAKGKAFLIAVGVNAYEDRDLDLFFAASDARRILSVLVERFRNSEVFKEIVPVLLVSEFESREGGRQVTLNHATRELIATALGRLAGREMAPSIPEMSGLRRAEPEDLVLIWFSGHGHVDVNGRFYILPADVGGSGLPGHGAAKDLLTGGISTDELTLWLRDIDAGRIVMIIDACNAAAAVENGEFKPGPMDSPGLGQLAYDKQMLILAASQVGGVALEGESIRQGLLTYALAHDGIDAGKADFHPRDGVITLKEWLRYGVKRVPGLFEEMKGRPSQAVDAEDRAILVLVDPQARLDLNRRALQQPVIFNFANSRYLEDLVLKDLP